MATLTIGADVITAKSVVIEMHPKPVMVLTGLEEHARHGLSSHEGREQEFTFRPSGNSQPTADEPHFTGVARVDACRGAAALLSVTAGPHLKETI